VCALASAIPTWCWFLFGEIGYLWMEQPNQSIGKMLQISHLIHNQTTNTMKYLQQAQSLGLQMGNGGHMVHVIVVTCIYMFYFLGKNSIDMSVPFISMDICRNLESKT
jgi:hypothetical protein